MVKCENGLPENSSAVRQLRSMVNSFKETMPIVIALRNEKLWDWHWAEIWKILGNPDVELERMEFTLGILIKIEVDKYSEEIIM